MVNFHKIKEEEDCVFFELPVPLLKSENKWTYTKKNIFIALPFISLAIAYFYFVSKHPWSSFLNDSWSEDPHPPDEVISKFDITKELVETELDNLTKLLKDKGYHEGEDAIFKEIERLKQNIAEWWEEGWNNEHNQGESSGRQEAPLATGCQFTQTQDRPQHGMSKSVFEV